MYKSSIGRFKPTNDYMHTYKIQTQNQKQKRPEPVKVDA